MQGARSNLHFLKVRNEENALRRNEENALRRNEENCSEGANQPTCQ
jgi:hypothetical protein